MSILDRLDSLDAAEDLSELQLGNVGARTTTGDGDGLAPEPEEQDAVRPPINPMAATATGLLAAAAVGWMLGGAFVGMTPRVLGVLGAVIGAVIVGLSNRMRSPLLLQLLALPITVAIGYVLVQADAKGTSVPQLVIDAVKAGGLSQPPAPFDPGWRLILLVLSSAVAVLAAASAVASNRLRLAVLIPAPLVGVGVLVQPHGKELVSVAPSIVLLVAALAVAFGGELSRDTETGARFESRRLLRAGGMLLLIVGAIVGMSKLGFLYPPTPDSTIVPPKRPQTPPAISSDAVLFTVKAQQAAPLRLGVLDVYDGTAWLTPPYDPKRYITVSDARVPAFAPVRADGYDKPQPAPQKTITAEISIGKPGPAREIPDLSNTVSVTGAPKGSEYDPRSQVLRLPGHAKSGQTYTVTAAAPPNAIALEKATVKTALPDFTQVPTAPPAVQDLLDAAPKNNIYERLQYVRTKFYSKITAAGPGNPVDVPPARVQQFLTGTSASPYEITASEVLLARWAGVPARIGYGYYNSDAKPSKDGTIEIRPADGAMWLEVYFDNTGWTPILGKPPKAQSSLDDAKKKNDKSVLPNGLITAQLYLPIKQQGLSLLYTIVQFWLVRAAAALGGLLFFWIVFPGLIKAFRRWRRRRWAESYGPRTQLAAAYAELRDRAIDLNIGHPTLTPLEFLDALEPDEEHQQLAWLVTRGLWGDLRRDLQADDIRVAETLGRSMARRLSAGQPFLTRVIAYGSRVSLRDPWDPTLPNPYWKRNPIALVFGWARAVPKLARRALRIRPRMVLALGRSSAIVLICALFLSGCVKQLSLSNTAAGVAALPKIPSTVGAFSIEATPVGDAQFSRYRDITLIQKYGFYVVRQEKVAVGTLQTASFKAGLKAENKKVREGVLKSLGSTPKVSKVGGEVFYTVSVNDLRLLVWFPPDGLTYQLLAATTKLADPGQLFAQLIATEQGRSADSVDTRQGLPPADARRQAP